MGARNWMPLLLAAAFLTFFDRGQLPPMLTTLAADLGVDVATAGAALTGYVIAYAAGQLAWSAVSSRVGRIRVLTISTAFGAVGNLVSALAVEPVLLVIGRALAGLAFGATVPAILVTVGDTMPMRQRGVAAANLAAALSLGMTVGTLVGAAAAEWLHWRVVFGLTAVLAVGVAALLARLPEPVSPAAQPTIPALGRVLRNGAAVGILALTVAEGVVLVGVLAYLPPALESAGESVVIAGGATALFGVAVIGWSRLVARLVLRLPSWVLLAAGATTAVAGYGILAVHVAAWTAGIAAVLLGFAWAAAHTQLQTWMTDAVVDARPVGMALFATALFGGGALGTWAGSAVAPTGAYPSLFAATAGLAAAFGIAAATGRARYRLRET